MNLQKSCPKDFNADCSLHDNALSQNKLYCTHRQTGANRWRTTSRAFCFRCQRYL